MVYYGVVVVVVREEYTTFVSFFNSCFISYKSFASVDHPICCGIYLVFSVYKLAIKFVATVSLPV